MRWASAFFNFSRTGVEQALWEVDFAEQRLESVWITEHYFSGSGST